MIDQAFIQQERKGKLRIEEEKVVEELSKLDIPINFFSSKHIRRRALPLTASSLVVGDMDCAYGAMKQLGIDIPKANSYPSSLKSYFCRNISKGNLKDIQAKIIYGDNFKPVFIKPSEVQKKFTGFVLENEQDLYNLGSTSRNIEVWCSEIVKWKSEWRIYVINHEVRHMSWYEGNIECKPNTDIVNESVNTLKVAGESPSSYAIDFGVLDSGETALIEMNDGFAVGAYEVPSKDYAEMVITR